MHTWTICSSTLNYTHYQTDKSDLAIEFENRVVVVANWQIVLLQPIVLISKLAIGIPCDRVKLVKLSPIKL